MKVASEKSLRLHVFDVGAVRKIWSEGANGNAFLTATLAVRVPLRQCYLGKTATSTNASPSEILDRSLGLIFSVNQTAEH